MFREDCTNVCNKSDHFPDVLKKSRREFVVFVSMHTKQPGKCSLKIKPEKQPGKSERKSGARVGSATRKHENQLHRSSKPSHKHDARKRAASDRTTTRHRGKAVKSMNKAKAGGVPALAKPRKNPLLCRKRRIFTPVHIRAMQVHV